MSRIVTFASLKGGVGKTTCSFLAARALAATGARVLAVDLDPQASLSVCFPNVNRNLYGFLASRPGRGGRLVSASGIPGLSVLGGSAQLLDLSLGKRPTPKLLATRLRHHTMHDHFDFVVIDTPPAVSTLSLLGFATADVMILVTHAEVWALRALSILWAMLGNGAGAPPAGSRFEDLRILINAYDDEQQEQRDAKDVVFERYGKQCISTALPLSDDLQNLSLHDHQDPWLVPSIAAAVDALLAVVAIKSPTTAVAENTQR